MYCTECGKQIVDDSKFCSYCGKSTLGPKETIQTVWESCQILATWEKVTLNILKQFDYKCYFWGDAMSPRGKFSAGKSSEYRVRGIHWNSDLLNQPSPPTGNSAEDKAKSAKSHKELVDKLIAEGWQYTDRGTHWWEYRFKREVPGNK